MRYVHNEYSLSSTTRTVFSLMYKDAGRKRAASSFVCTSGYEVWLAIREARRAFGGATEELHGFDAQSEPFAGFALVDVQAG